MPTTICFSCSYLFALSFCVMLRYLFPTTLLQSRKQSHNIYPFDFFHTSNIDNLQKYLEELKIRIYLWAILHLSMCMVVQADYSSNNNVQKPLGKPVRGT